MEYTAIGDTVNLVGLVHKVVPDSLNHSDAIGVFRQRFNSDQDLEYSKYLTRLIAKKKIVMYESRMPTPSEANSMVKDARIFLAWVEERTKSLQEKK